MDDFNVFVESTKCREDFAYFCKTCIIVKDPIKGKIPFELKPIHFEMLEVFENERYVAVKKYRSGGFSTFSALYLLWKSLFNSDLNSVFITNNDAVRERMFNLLNQCITNAPLWIQEMCDNPSKSEGRLSFNSNSVIDFQTQSIIGAGTQRKIDYCVLDEAGYFLEMNRFWVNLFPAINGKCFVVSTTACGWFENLCVGAAAKTNAFALVQADYRKDPYWDDEIKIDNLKKTLGDIAFRREMLCEFLDDPKISNIKHNNGEFMDSVKEYDGSLWPNGIKELPEVINLNEIHISPSMGYTYLKEDKGKIEPVKIDKSFIRSSLEDVSGFSEKCQHEYEKYIDAENSSKTRKKAILKDIVQFEDNVDLLKMAGVYDTEVPAEDIIRELAEEDGKIKSVEYYRRVIGEQLSKDNIKVSFKEFLCINDAPTKIRTEYVDSSTSGLQNLIGEEKTTKIVVQALKRKLNRLF